MPTPHLFRPLTFRSVTLPNRIAVSPMCQYSSRDGLFDDWHLVHLGSRAVGGAGLVFTEATSVSPEGRISPGDAGLWNDEQAESLRPIVRFVQEHGSVMGIQLGHAGRKASCARPWEGGKPIAPDAGGWVPVGPTSQAFSSEHTHPQTLTLVDCDRLIADFVSAAKRAADLGIEVVEVHAAHGYLLHSFLSPLSNTRDDIYGGSLENRMAFPLRVVKAVREAWPQDHPLFVRISASDWADGGWDLEQSKAFAKELLKLDVDLVDCSSGGNVEKAAIETGPGYQVPFAAGVKSVGIATGAVGEITTAEQAETIVRTGQADIVLLAREMLRDPYWPLHAAMALKVKAAAPPQYERAYPRS